MGPFHTDVKILDDQLEHINNNSLRTQDDDDDDDDDDAIKYRS